MAADAPEVVVRGSVAGFAQEITVGAHRIFSDEPQERWRRRCRAVAL